MPQAGGAGAQEGVPPRDRTPRQGGSLYCPTPNHRRDQWHDRRCGRRVGRGNGEEAAPRCERCNISGKDDFIAATRPWVTTVQYDYAQGLEQEALRWIGATAGRDEALRAVCEKFASIGLVLHGSEGEIMVTESASITSSTFDRPDIALFMNGLHTLLGSEGRIDCFGCDVAGSPEGRQLIAKLEDMYSVNIAASNDITTAQKGGDMVLETDDVDVTALYFDRERLSRWGGTLSGVHTGHLQLGNRLCAAVCGVCDRQESIPSTNCQIQQRHWPHRSSSTHD